LSVLAPDNKKVGAYLPKMKKEVVFMGNFNYRGLDIVWETQSFLKKPIHHQ